MSPILDLQKRLVEVGRIRMGMRSSGGSPQKLDTFRLTSRDESRIRGVATVYGGTVRPWKERDGEFEVVTKTAELPILLLPGQALTSWYELWSAGGAQRRCDGVTDVLSDGPCVCDAERGPRKCKPTTRLSVMLPEIPGLGVWRLESHGFYAAVELAATAGMLEQATARGQMFPARLRIDQRSQVKEGKTTRYAVPVIDIDVLLPEALAGVGARLAIAPPPDEPQYTPIAELNAGVSVVEGLDAAARQAAPKARTARSAAPIGSEIDFMNSAPIPVPDDDGVSLPPPPAPVETTKPSAAQVKKLNTLFGRLEKGGRINRQQLYAAMAIARNVDADVMIELVGGRDTEGSLHWAPLRDSLTADESSMLIDRLDRLDKTVTALEEQAS